MKFFAINIFRAFSLTILILAFSFAAHAQEQVVTSDMNKEIKDLLGKYVYLIGAIKADSEPDPVRPFVQLFRNIRVKVHNDLDVDHDPEMISVRDYGEKIKKLYPEGINYSIDLDQIKLGKAQENEGNRFIIGVKVRRTIELTIDGQANKRTEKVLFLIGYEIEDGVSVNFLIHGILPVASHDQDLIIAFSPLYSRINNANLSTDTRFEIPWEISWRSSLNYQFMINNSWGLGTGVIFEVNRHTLKMDKFDPLNGHDSNLTDIEWQGELTYFEIPFYGIYQRNIGRKFIVEIAAGGFAAYRIFESIKSQAVNRHNGDILNGVISDPFNYENISNYNFGLDLGLGLKYSLTKKVGVFVKTGFRQGLISLEKEVDEIIPYNIYQGQFNPMFYKSGSPNYSQDLSFQTGLSFRIFGDNYYN